MHREDSRGTWPCRGASVLVHKHRAWPHLGDRHGGVARVEHQHSELGAGGQAVGASSGRVREGEDGGPLLAAIGGGRKC